MKHRISWTPDARRDVDELADYIVRDNLDAAVRFLMAFERELRKLA